MAEHFDKPPKVFISYSHDSRVHCEKVLQFSNRLRSQGIDSWIDQYAPFPHEGWPLWAEKQIEESDFVLVICTKTYAKRANAEETNGTGLGVRYESHLIRQGLYNAGAYNHKFIPILLGNASDSYIPIALQGYNYYRVDDASDYEKLYVLLTHQDVRMSPLGPIRKFAALNYCRRPRSDYKIHMASKWLMALSKLRKTGQIDSATMSGILQYVTNDSCPEDDPSDATLAEIISDSPNWEQQLWLSLGEEQIAAKNITTANGRLHQVLTAIRFDLNLVIEELGVRFILIPPGITWDERKNRSVFYLAEAPVSRLEWHSIMADASDGSKNVDLAMTELSVNRIRAFLSRANKLLKSRVFFQFPTMSQWLFASAFDHRPANPPSDMPTDMPILRSGQPNIFHLHDLGGVVWQFCREQDRFFLVGGSYAGGFDGDDTKLPSMQCTATGFESSEFGFRPVLVISKEALNE